MAHINNQVAEFQAALYLPPDLLSASNNSAKGKEEEVSITSR
ncbi:736_t:CDS:2 [Cetraspora pellucida]|uniref:736_t:CDS:1 n=1 Tax=Cetraspora pellucida TaxID=1433469 RepID=A0A9N9EBA4_9GLOM|nr:736_t:CDS:2 [Cetraspora pellucida]